jgi:protein-disulfide isomerase
MSGRVLRYVRVLVVIGAATTAGFAGRRAWAARGAVTLEPAPAAALDLDATAALVAGPADAPVVVRIFGDYGCPACQQLERAVADSLLALARNGRLRLVYVQRPLAASTAGEAMALAVACTPPARAWAVHRHLYRARERSHPADVRLPDDLTGTEEFQACVSSAATRERVRAAIAAARAAGFHEVPVVLVNDVRLRYRTHAALLRHITSSLE